MKKTTKMTPMRYDRTLKATPPFLADGSSKQEERLSHATGIAGSQGTSPRLRGVPSV